MALDAPFFKGMLMRPEGFLGYGPAPEPTLKKALCYIRAVGGALDIYRA